MTPQGLIASIQYEWEPFSLDGSHLTFAEYPAARLDRGKISHWGPAVYKWEGLIRSVGGFMDVTAFGTIGLGKRGILIGETSDLRQAIKRYVSGPEGRFQREQFLNWAEARLFVLNLHSLSVSGREPLTATNILRATNLRIMLKHLLVMQAVAEADPSTWVVNESYTGSGVP